MSTIRIFRQYIPVSYILLAIIEISVFLFSLYLGVLSALKVQLTEIEDYFEPLAFEAAFFSITMFFSLVAVGLYQRRLQEGYSSLLARIILAVCLGVLLIHQLSYIFPDLDMSPRVWISIVGWAFLGIILVRFSFYRMLRADTLKRRVLVLGEGEKATELKSALTLFNKQGLKLVGFVPLADKLLGLGANLILASQTDLLMMVEKSQADQIVVAIDNKHHGFPSEQLMKCKLAGIEVIDIVSFYERELGKIMINWISPSWFIYADGFQHGAFWRRAKRFSDILVSIILILITFPVIAMVAISIWLESGGRGPIFYRQSRVGQYGKIFELLKFRSMQINAEQDGKARWAQKNDNRVTRIGKWLRRTRIDELPQVINVLKGEMSFVGPRPERPEFVSELEKKIPFYQERHVLKPGITGWAQVCYPYGATEKDALEKLQYDLYYVKNSSLFLDFVILLQTAEVILWGKGR
ncbi:MAG: TIGR03013 family XrtA/PEP-CTERM system glycosyltransferase [Gammaproteobacteria bacterium]